MNAATSPISHDIKVVQKAGVVVVTNIKIVNKMSELNQDPRDAGIVTVRLPINLGVDG